MIEKSCLDCGHNEVCGNFRVLKEITLLFLQGYSEFSDEKIKEAISSTATCFGSICAEWLSKSKL